MFSAIPTVTTGKLWDCIEAFIILSLQQLLKIYSSTNFRWHKIMKMSLARCSIYIETCRFSQCSNVPHQKVAIFIDGNVLTPEMGCYAFGIMKYNTRPTCCLPWVYIIQPLEKITTIRFWSITGIEKATLKQSVL